MTSTFQVFFLISATHWKPGKPSAWINKLSTCIDPVPNFDPAISPLGEDIETREINDCIIYFEF